eukprot:gene4896-8490_t
MTDFQIPKDFKVQKGGMIHQSNNSHVYLGDFNSQPSILKIFPSKYPSEEIIRFYQKDYQINMLLYEKYPNHFSKPIKFKNEENELYSIKSSLGISLQQHQKETKTFNTPEFLKLGIQICQALHFIHEQNVIHCDIKPQNIMMMDDALIIREELFENSKTNIEKLKVVSPLIKLHLIKLNYKKATEYIFAIFDLYDFTKETTTLKDPNEIRKFSVKLYNEIKEFIKKIETTKEFLDAIPNHSNEEMTLFCEFNISANSAFHHMWNFEMLIASRLIGALAIIKFGYNDYAAGLLSSGSWFGHCVFKKSDLKKIGLFAYDLFNRIENPTLKLFAMMTLAYNFQFCGSAEQGMEIGHKGYTLALSVGEYTYGPQCIWAEFEFKLVTGCNFARLYNQIESAKKIIYGAGNIFIGDLIELASERCAVLTGRKNEFSPKIKIPNFETRELTRSILSCAKIFGLYLLRDYDSAKKLVDEFSSISVESIGLPMHYEVYFYSILVCYSLSSPIDYVEDIKKNLDILKEHYDINPQYFSAQYFLADAIYQSLVNSNTQQVFNSFLKALKYSKHIDFHSALTYEYFSKFCNQNAEFAEFADFFESKAFVKYKRMEAFCKYKHLRNIDFMKTEGSTSDSTSLNQISSSPFSGITSYASGNSIDLQTILKSSETIAEGLNKEKLLKKLNQVIVQNAGAEKDAEFQLGVKFFSQKKFIEALKIFEGLKNEKKVCEYYINVCELYEHSSLPEGWNGEIKLSKDGDPELFTSEEIFKKKEKILIQQLMRNPEKFAFILEEAKKFDQKE